MRTYKILPLLVIALGVAMLARHRRHGHAHAYGHRRWKDHDWDAW